MVDPARLRVRRWLVGFFGLVSAALALTAGAALALAPDRDGLWKVVGACVADQRLTGLPFPCLAVDLGEGQARGHILLRPPWANDLILSPTRRIVGIEDPFLQSPAAPNYFAESWAARGMIATAKAVRRRATRSR
jgi:CDP-diacylglycerol pyrophosphatase